MARTTTAYGRYGAAVLAGAIAIAAMLPLPGAHAGDLNTVETEFDHAFTLPASRALESAPPARTFGAAGFARNVAALADARQGRIGVAAVDLSTGKGLDVLGDQPFPMASTAKVAIVATFLDGVDHGLYRLDNLYPLMIPVPSHRFDGAVAPVRPGARLSAVELIELAITRSDNHATDGLLAAIGGPRAVNAWLRRTGNGGLHLDHDIATMVRDDGAVNPAFTVDRRDSATPVGMVQLLSGLYRGQWLSPASQQVLLGAMSRCVTGKRRMRANLPEGALIAHKTGTLANTSSDVGIITTPSGRVFAVAIYVTGQGAKPAREARIATIARAIYDGYEAEPLPLTRTASR